MFKSLCIAAKPFPTLPFFKGEGWEGLLKAAYI